MSVLGSERVRRSFDVDVVILKSQTPGRDCVHGGITLLRARGRIAGLSVEKARNRARFAPAVEDADKFPSHRSDLFSA
jgi:hypothetical protein